MDFSKPGYPISHSVARALKAHEEEILANPVFRKKFTNPETGKLFGPGEQIKTRLATLLIWMLLVDQITEAILRK